MADSLERHVGRITKATKNAEKSVAKMEQASKRLVRRCRDLGVELVRPNDKILDCAAKTMEYYSTLYSTIATAIDDLADMVPDVTDVVRKARDEKGYHTAKAVQAAFTGVKGDDLN